MKKIPLTLTLILLLIGVNVWAGDGDFIVNGKLGIGTTNPAGLLEISGLITLTDPGTDSIPTMTSNTSPSGKASADSEWASYHSAWKAMEDSNNSAYACWASGQFIKFPHWLQYQFPSGKIITSYSITSRNDALNVSPNAWKLQGSNTGTSWTDLDAKSGQSFNQNEKKTYSFTNAISYSYYRLVITAGAYDTVVAIGEFELMEPRTPRTELTSLLFMDNTTGNIGIRTTNPGNYKLNVNGPLYASTIYQGSDIRWKKNINPIKNAQSIVKRLQGVRFDWKLDEFKDKNFDSGRQIGLIAQDVEKVVPEIVKTDAEGYKSVAYDKLTAVLIEALKEQQKEIKELRTEIKKLKNK